MLGYVCALEEQALAAPQLTAPRLAQAQALDFEAFLGLELRRRQVTAEAHVPAAQLRGVPKDGVLSGRGVQLDQHRPDATTVHGIVLRGIKPVHVTRMGRARPADAGPPPCAGPAGLRRRQACRPKRQGAARLACALVGPPDASADKTKIYNSHQ